MIKFLRSFFCLMLVCGSISQAKKLEFVDANFDDFMNRLIAQEEEKNEFKVYYSSLNKKMQEAGEEKRCATLRYLYDLALMQLKEKHNDWYQEISPLVCDPHCVLDEKYDDLRKIVRFFLSRYGAYEEYLNFKNGMAEKQAQIVAQASAKTGIWESFKTYCAKAKNTVAGWFGLGKTS